MTAAAFAVQIGAQLRTAPVKFTEEVYGGAAKAAEAVARAFRLIARESGVAVAAAPPRDRLAQRAALHIAGASSRGELGELGMASWHRWVARECRVSRYWRTRRRRRSDCRKPNPTNRS